jgi:methionine-gamma-lyase
MANSYVLPYDPSDVNWSSADSSPLYTRNGGANQNYLQERIAILEGGEEAVVLASGVAALSGTFFALLNHGDHVIFSDVTYIAVYRLLNELLNEKYGVETSIIDTSDLEAVKKAIRPNTKLIHIESPGNPTLKICDISALAEIAHKNNALLSVDNTFSSPYNQRPLELGADIVIESLTKYINGHGDAMGGSVVSTHEIITKIKEQSMVNLGGTISPFNAWLIMRGSTTLPLRMQKHNENGQKVAEYLESLPCVTFVAYPGLESFKGHELAKKQMKGFGGMLSFGIKADHDTHNKFVSHLKLITSAVSLGHGASLIVFLGEDDERQYLYPEEFHNGFFRFSAGLEDAEDIIADLDQAFKAVGLL